MPMLPSRLFVSEADTFLRDYRRAHPAVAQQQKEGLALWWDRPREAVARRHDLDRARIAQTPYVYGADRD